MANMKFVSHNAERDLLRVENTCKSCQSVHRSVALLLYSKDACLSRLRKGSHTAPRRSIFLYHVVY